MHPPRASPELRSQPARTTIGLAPTTSLARAARLRTPCFETAVTHPKGTQPPSAATAATFVRIAPSGISCDCSAYTSDPTSSSPAFAEPSPSSARITIGLGATTWCTRRSDPGGSGTLAPSPPPSPPAAGGGAAADDDGPPPPSPPAVAAAAAAVAAPPPAAYATRRSASLLLLGLAPVGEPPGGEEADETASRSTEAGSTGPPARTERMPAARPDDGSTRLDRPSLETEVAQPAMGGSSGPCGAPSRGTCDAHVRGCA